MLLRQWAFLRISAECSFRFLEHSKFLDIFYYRFADLQKLYLYRKSGDGIRSDKRAHADHTLPSTGFSIKFSVCSFRFLEHSKFLGIFYYHFVDLRKLYLYRKNGDGIRSDKRVHADHTLPSTAFFNKILIVCSFRFFEHNNLNLIF